MPTDSEAQKRADLARITVLTKLADIGTPMNMLEIGFSATAQIIRNMAARGLVRVRVEITTRGLEHLAKEKAKVRRIKTNVQKERRLAEASDLDVPKTVRRA